MRGDSEWKSIKVKADTKACLENNRVNFEKVIGGGKWSLDDTIKEIIKIAEAVNK